MEKDPAFYESHFRVYNRPEFVTEPIPLTQRQILRALHDRDTQLRATLEPRLRRPDGVSGATNRR